jgi:hypothetical protein
VQKRQFLRAASRLHWAFAAETFGLKQQQEKPASNKALIWRYAIFLVPAMF